MSRTRIESIQLVRNMAQAAEDEAAKALSQHHIKLMQEEQQLLDLQSYAVQYMQEQAGLHQGIYADALINYSSFIAHLNEACREQVAKLETLRQTQVRLDRDWQMKHQKRQSIEELIARLIKETNQLIERQLQKELDELVVQQAQRQRLTS
jgi:flagellar protein FliJ